MAARPAHLLKVGDKFMDRATSATQVLTVVGEPRLASAYGILHAIVPIEYQGRHAQA